MLARLLLLVFSVAFGLGAVEIGARLLHAETDDYLKTLTPYHSFFAPDRLAGHVHQSNATLTLERPEHPARIIEMRTNNLGLRADHDTTVTKPAGRRRILVVGDSHTDGYCFNRETYPAELEQRLRRQFPDRDIEVLNAGVAYYSPLQDYLHATQLLSLRPDLIVVGLYAGNDLLDQRRDTSRGRIPTDLDPLYLALWTHAEVFRIAAGAWQTGRSRLKTRTLDYDTALRRAGGMYAPAVWQALNQALYFHHFPGELAAAERSVGNALHAFKRLCARSGCQVLVLVIPSKVTREWDTDAAQLDALADSMQLSRQAMRLDDQVARDLVMTATEAGLPAIRLEDPCPAAECYYRSDYHLNPDGNRLVAATLQPWVAKQLAQLPQ